MHLRLLTQILDIKHSCLSKFCMIYSYYGKAHIDFSSQRTEGIHLQFNLERHTVPLSHRIYSLSFSLSFLSLSPSHTHPLSLSLSVLSLSLSAPPPPPPPPLSHCLSLSVSDTILCYVPQESLVVVSKGTLPSMVVVLSVSEGRDHRHYR